jgi:hypothetical protein
MIRSRKLRSNPIVDTAMTSTISHLIIAQPFSSLLVIGITILSKEQDVFVLITKYFQLERNLLDFKGDC